MHDVIIIGGSYAGLAAAIQLGRARRSVLVIDAGERRNRFAHAAHGFLGQDGQPPGAIAATGRAEALAYPTVAWLDAAATHARVTADGFAVRAGGEEHAARRLVLATGVADELPAIPGLAERWGATAFHCPYCHGYELPRGHLGVLATSEASLHQAALVNEWANATTLFLNGAFEPDPAQLAELAARRIAVERAAVRAVSGDAPAIALHLADGRAAALDGLVLLPRARLVGPFAEQLGCALEQGPMGPFYKTDPMMKETSVRDVFACGDAAQPTPSIAFAVADGVRAGVSAHRSLVFARAA
jgi:thioredoxin reductase